VGPSTELKPDQLTGVDDAAIRLTSSLANKTYLSSESVLDSAVVRAIDEFASNEEAGVEIGLSLVGGGIPLVRERGRHSEILRRRRRETKRRRH
jgi:hypothetical protein